ncbi:hypothetical protein, partial [Arthrobacter sp.]|uniref:hypothetical protein n=1 Tax=Arthrobacter sp. TaxID=1667 RepID=UPI003A90CC03
MDPRRDPDQVVLEVCPDEFAGVDVQRAANNAAGMDIQTNIGTIGHDRDLHPSLWHYHSTAVG